MLHIISTEPVCTNRIQKFALRNLLSHLKCFGGYAHIRHEIDVVPDVTECVDISICGE